LQPVVQQLQDQKAAGLLEAIRRETRLIQRSGLYDPEISPVNALLTDAVDKARELR
jgi:hypothetical protein